MSDFFRLGNKLASLLLVGSALSCAGSTVPIPGLPDRCEAGERPTWTDARVRPLLDRACPVQDMECRIGAMGLVGLLLEFDDSLPPNANEGYRLVHSSRRGTILLSMEMRTGGPIIRLKLSSRVGYCGGHFIWKCERSATPAEWHAVSQAAVASQNWQAERFPARKLDGSSSFLEAVRNGNYDFAYGSPDQFTALAPVASALLQSGSCGSVEPVKIIGDEFPRQAFRSRI